MEACGRGFGHGKLNELVGAMSNHSLHTIHIDDATVVKAPDGSDVRLLAETRGGGMAQFALDEGAVARAVGHRTIEEMWFVTSGIGRMWRRMGDEEDIVDLRAGVALTIPTGAHFQFRSDSGGRLTVIAVTLPPWPGEGEAYSVAGLWEPTV